MIGLYDLRTPVVAGWEPYTLHGLLQLSSAVATVGGCVSCIQTVLLQRHVSIQVLHINSYRGICST